MTSGARPAAWEATKRQRAALAGSVGRWFGEAARLLLPAGCIACGRWYPGSESGPMTCGPCRTRLAAAPWPRCPRCHFPLGTGRVEAEACRECRTWPPALTRARYAVLLKPPADALVHGLKYEGWRGLAVEMGEAMARAARSSMRRDGWGADGVVAVPTTAKRRRRRGYNQARLLAHVVAEQLELPVSGALKRVRGGATQVSLPPALRLDNVRGAFTPAPGAGSVVTGRHLLLVDDVLTTGATACAAAEALHGAGAASVTLVTFARALPFQEKVDTF